MTTSLPARIRLGRGLPFGSHHDQTTPHLGGARLDFTTLMEQ